MASHLNIGLPQIHTAKGKKCIPPTNDFIAGTWHVTHSSLPLWKGKQNVNITYELLPPDSSGVIKIDDLVKYQAAESEKIKSVHGIDTPSPDDGNQWVVTYFAKTLFTPAGIDIYSRSKEGLLPTFVEEILKALRELGVVEITTLANEIFQVPQN